MAPTEGRIAKPERQWGCRRGTPDATTKLYYLSLYMLGQ